jgi:tetratricopeptide (TPR) repeat protein
MPGSYSAAAFRDTTATLYLTAREDALALEQMHLALEALSREGAPPEMEASLLSKRALCELHLGDVASGTRDMNQAEQILRRGEMSVPKAVGLGSLGVWLFQYGRGEEGARLLGESVLFLDRAGEASKSAAFRMSLASIHCSAGRLEEAEAALPAADEMNQRQSRSVLLTRGTIALRAGRVEEAIAVFEEALRLARADPQEIEPKVAVLEDCLAHALLEAGRLEEAEALAEQAAAVATTCGPAVTLALIAHRKGESSAAARLEKAFAGAKSRRAERRSGGLEGGGARNLGVTGDFLAPHWLQSSHVAGCGWFGSV